jgi:CTP:molybdopterin cytidylyltransferase MocA
MGRPKLLLPWACTSILGHLIDQWKKLRATQIAVVCAPDNSEVVGELTRLGFLREASPSPPLEERAGERRPIPTAGDLITNPHPDQGMFSSIKCAANWPGWNGSLSHCALVLGDQPHLRPSTLQATINLAAAQPQKVVQPSRAGHRRHPVLLPKSEFSRLAESSAPNLNQFLLTCQITVFESDDPGLDLDIDRPEDYAQALLLASS